jgi:hypothetical protein
METIARSSEQYAEAKNARARCRRNGESTPSNNKEGPVIAQARGQTISRNSMGGKKRVSPAH